MTTSRIFVPVLLAALVMAGCGTTPTASPGPPASHSTSSAAPAPPAYNPPHRFSARGIPVGSGPVALADGIAYSYTDTTLVSTDLATGESRWSVPLPGATTLVTGWVSGGTTTPPPAPQTVTDTTGAPLIVAAYPITTTGTGTQRDATNTRVVAVDQTGNVRWQKKLALPDGAAPTVVGGISSTRGVAVVVDSGGATVVLDAATGTPWWRKSDVEPLGTSGDTVIGVRSSDGGDTWSSVGLHGNDGGQAWSRGDLGTTGVIGRPPTLIATGPARAVVLGIDDPLLIDATSGATVAKLTDSASSGLFNFSFNNCSYDGVSTVVCWAKGEDPAPTAVGGFDSHDGHRLWIVGQDDPDRTPVNLTCVYDGVIYGTTDHGDVELDARSGQDALDTPGLAPDQVTAGWGLVTDMSRQTRPAIAYRATS